jgi:hypothetical protein
MKPDVNLFGVQPQHGHDRLLMDAAKEAVGSFWCFKYPWIG